MEANASSTEEIANLIERVQLQGASTAFQSVAVAAAQVFNRAIKREEHALRAAISLAQREKLEMMLDELRSTFGALRAALNEQGLRLLTMTEETPLDPASDADKETWWFALSEAIHILEEDAKWMKSLICGQQPGAPAHELGTLISQLLKKHHDQLLLEAERWMA